MTPAERIPVAESSHFTTLPHPHGTRNMSLAQPEVQSGASEPSQNLRVALVHYWLLGQRGGEKVLESICRVFPQADIYTLFYEPDLVSPLIRSKNVVPSFLNPL